MALVLDFNSSLKDLDGKDLVDGNKGKLLASVLSQSAKGDSLKFWDWALRLHSGKALELDPSDTETLRSFIAEHQGLSVLAKAQLLEVFVKKAK